MTQKHTILRILKRLLLESQITYSALANELKLSEISVKRMLNGKTSLDIQRLEEILKILGVDFLHLAQQLTIDSELNLNQLSESQEKLLAKCEKLLAFFIYCYEAILSNKFAADMSFRKKKIFSLALKLERAKLLEVYPNNRIKLLVSRYVQWRDRGPLEHKFRETNQAHFLCNSFKGPNDLFRFITVLLPEKSLSIFIDQFYRLLQEMRETSTMREVRDPKLNKPFTLLLAGREYVPEFINRYLKAKK